ncbi:MAG: sigma-70 family RNA polymerase sigma factor [Anaerolineaceae bacterium]|nr:sigma-70 family RNA polymerase sigma factor [Anaerolineaceae bacterium]
MDDKQAIQRLKRGDVHALSHLINTYQLRAIRTAYLITQDTALAQDVVQNTFVSVYRSIRSFDINRPFAPYFMQSVVNAAVRSAQIANRNTSLDVPDDENESVETVPFIETEIQPDTIIETAETEALIWQVLGQLSATQRAVIVLRFYLDFSEAEIAEQLAIPTGTVKSRLHHAKRQLYSLLADHLEKGEL